MSMNKKAIAESERSDRSIEELIAAFQRIRDPQIRTSIIAFVKGLAEAADEWPRWHS